VSSNFKRPVHSIDCSIKEIPLGSHRVKIIGSVVSRSDQSILVNDGTYQIIISSPTIQVSEFSVGSLYRFLIEVKKSETHLTGILITAHEMSKGQVQRYKRVVKLERRSSI
jgi:hypothetical protein